MATEFKTVQFRRSTSQTAHGSGTATRVTWHTEPMKIAPGQVGVINLDSLPTIIGGVLSWPASDPGELLTTLFGAEGWQGVSMSMDATGERMTVLLQRTV